MKVYHITYPSNRQSILENGLIPKKSEKYSYLNCEPGIFVFIPKTHSDILVAFYHTRDENMDIWEVDIDASELKKDDKSEAENHFWIGSTVKAKLYKENVNMWEVDGGCFL